jgi:hypothetical protein
MNPKGFSSSKEILFITSNDGSDMRINKEIKSLARAGASVHFLGITSNETSCFIRESCASVSLIHGPRNSPATIIRLVWKAWMLFFRKNISSIHIINEQLMVFFYPLMFLKHSVLDIFDSVFLKWNKPGEKWTLIKWLVYLPVNSILVTDERRFRLMPAFARDRCKILPNYPCLRMPAERTRRTAPLCILFNGWMGLNRGTEIAEGLLKTGLPLKLIMAGWFSDDHTRGLLSAYTEKIDFRGVVPQETALRWAEQEADYILCVYSPINSNNINASPNKIYDAIHTGTPVIINAEVAVSAMVKEHQTGFILNSYQVSDFHQLYRDLLEARNNFHWDDELRRQFSWELSEAVLFQSHRIS